MSVKTVYKVLLRDQNNILWSSSQGLMSQEWEVRYEIGTEIRPNISGSLLLAFDSLATAATFRWRVGLEVFEAESEDPINFPISTNNRWNEFWTAWVDNNNSLPKGFNRVKNFSGTLGCRSMTLIRKVKEDEITQARTKTA